MSKSVQPLISAGEDCLEADEEDDGEIHHYVLIQEIEHKDVTGFRCEMKESTFEFECGMFSHLATVSQPKVMTPVELTENQCRRWATFGKMKYGRITFEIFSYP